MAVSVTAGRVEVKSVGRDVNQLGADKVGVLSLTLVNSARSRVCLGEIVVDFGRRRLSVGNLREY